MGNRHSVKWKPPTSSEEQRAILKYFYQKKNSVTKAHRKLVQFAGQSALSKSSVGCYFAELEQKKWIEDKSEERDVSAQNDNEQDRKHTEWTSDFFQRITRHVVCESDFTALSVERHFSIETKTRHEPPRFRCLVWQWRSRNMSCWICIFLIEKKFILGYVRLIE